MEKYTYVTLRERPELKAAAAEWFHCKWGIPAKTYLECMDEYLNQKTEYGWEFLCMVQGDGESDMTRMYIHR